ncbi:hypothetical protein ACFLQN_01965 [Candidatus Aenigmatarchaeota archaeon]
MGLELTPDTNFLLALGTYAVWEYCMSRAATTPNERAPYVDSEPPQYHQQTRMDEVRTRDLRRDR